MFWKINKVNITILLYLIFDRFYKCKNSNKDSIGIGLALAKSIVESSNGTITVESNKERTIFEVKYYKI